MNTEILTTAEYEQYRIEAQLALDKAVGEIISISNALKLINGSTPFRTITGRVKEFDSVLRKCERKNYPATIDSVKKNMLDFAGIRIIALYPDELHQIIEIIRSAQGFNVEEEEDYVSCPKESGYRSFHMSIRYSIFSPIEMRPKLIPIEIQIRTKGMDLWASVEHMARYKKKVYSPEAKALFEEAAAYISKFEEAAMRLRDYSEEEDDVESAEVALAPDIIE